MAATTGSMSNLPERLAEAAAGRGVAAAAVIEQAGGDARACRVPALDEEPAFLAYSITKTITATVILSLADGGRVGLDDPLARWFPDIAQADRISLRHLLNHTSGIPDYGGLRAYHEAVRTSPSTPWSFERFGDETFRKGLSFAPGTGWGYSNPAYMLLKRIAEAAGGGSYRALVTERITRPLGLERTFVAESLADMQALAPGTSRLLSPDGSARDVRAHYHPGWVSHGVVASTPSEVARFVDALCRGAILSTASRTRMMELVEVAADPRDAPTGPDGALRRGRPSYGLGLMADPASPWGLVLGHNGGGPCYSASVFHAVDLGGATVCAMGAIEQGFEAERVVFDELDRLAARHGRAHNPS